MVFKWFALGSKPAKTFEFQCAECGEIHCGSPSFSYAEPSAFLDVPEAEREDRVKIDPDTCVIDDETFYIRCLLEIPIHQVDEPFSWGVWLSQSRTSFERYLETYNRDQSGDHSTGWLAVTMPGYRRTAKGDYLEQLACDLHWQGGGRRPLVAPHACDHPLYLDFTEGISWDRAIELARAVIHPE